MEEAPLIIKKSLLGDKCGSCNQSLSSSNPTNQANNYLLNIPQNEDNNRYKLRAIQDSSNKYNSGSYSRILSYSNPDSLPNELKSSYIKNFSNNGSNTSSFVSQNLPDIKKKSTAVTPMRRAGSLKKIDEMNELMYNDAINDELEKKVVNANILISVSNKISECIDKKNNK